MTPAQADGPKYRRIAERLRQAIASGTYRPGARLPGENDLMRDEHVSRDTARKALGQLVNWNLAEARKGAGVYVRDFRPIIRDGISRLGVDTWPAGQSVWAAEIEGRTLAVDQIEVGEAEPPARVQALLGLGPGELAVMRSRRFVLDGKPVLVSQSWLPASIAAGTQIAERETGPGGIYARLADLGRRPMRFREDLRSRLPGPDEVARLSMATGTTIVEIVRTAYDAGGAVVEVNEMLADASAYIFRYDFNASAAE